MLASIRFPRRPDNRSNMESARAWLVFSRRVILLAVFCLLSGSIIAARATHQSQTAQQETNSNIARQNNPPATVLEPGKIIEREIAGGETQSYQIRLEAGQSAYIVIVDKGHNIKVQIRAFDPSERAINEVNSFVYSPIIEPLVVTADKSGNYRVQVFARWPGSYSIQLDGPRNTTDLDRKRLAAQQKLTTELESLPLPVSPQTVIQKAEEQASIYKSLGEERWEALSLYIIASSFQARLADYQKAIVYYEQARQLWHALGDHDAEFSALRLIAGVYSRLGDYQKALDYGNLALAVSRANGSRNEEAQSLHGVGVIYHLLADEQKALDSYQQSLAVQRLTDPNGLQYLSGQALTLNNIGNLYRGMGGDEKRLDYFNPKTSSDRQKALEYYNQALELYRIITKKFIPTPLYGESTYAQANEAFMLLKIGNTYAELADYEKAIYYLNQSLTLYRDVKNKGGEASVLRSIGNLYSRMGESQRAFGLFEQTIALLRAGADRQNETDFFNSIGVVYSAAGEKQKALDLHKESLSLSRERGQQSVAAAALYNIARIERDSGNISDARTHIEEALQTVESLRAGLASQDLRASYFATVRPYYDFYIDLLMRAHQKRPADGLDAIALQQSERARARGLLELLIEAHADIRQGVDPKLLARERSLHEQLNFKAAQQTQLLIGKQMQAQAQEVAKEINALTDEYDKVEAQIRAASPRYAALTQPAPLSLTEIQHQLLDSDTMLLEYALGQEQSYLWAVTPTSIASYALPKRSEIEAEVKSVYGLLTARNLRPKGETEPQRQARLSKAESEYQTASAHLSQILLGPVAQSLGSKRLLIVPDGALNYLPFAALPAPRTNTSTAKDWQPLMLDHEIVSLPSATALAVLRRDLAGRKPAPKAVTVIADPVFDKEDARVGVRAGHPQMVGEQTNGRKGGANTDSTTASVERDVERSAGEVGLVDNQAAHIPRLPFSRREADAIISLVQNSNGMEAVDFKANRATATSTELAQYRIIHFATHGLLNSQHPELSGVILSLVDERGAPQDGFLRLNEVYNLNLPAELVVLSACNTGLGKEVRGEGLVGLTRGFMYAGAARVAASMWRVDDAATAELMRLFYTGMLKDGRSPAAALRAAQVEMSAQKRWQSPYYWAAFVLQGEWK